jgi:hypothetical protein
MSLIERILDRVFPREVLPWGTRWKLCGELTGHEDTSRSLLKRPIRLSSGRSHYLHFMVKPDADRAPHDHRYDWSSRILRGSYTEVTRDPDGSSGFRTWIAGEVNRKVATQPHKILSVNGPTWTLFSTGPAYRDWGFVVADSMNPARSYWVHHEVYRRMDKEWADRQQQIAEKGMR